MVTGEDDAEMETVPEQGTFVGEPAGEDTGTCGVAAGAGSDTAAPPEDVTEATKPAASSLPSDVITMVALPEGTVTVVACVPVSVCTGVPEADKPL